MAAYGTMTNTDDTVIMALDGNTAAAVLLAGTWSGQVVFEVSNDKSTWQTLAMWDPINITALVATSDNGFYQFSDLSGVTHVRVRFDIATSGAVQATITGNLGTGSDALLTNLWDGTTYALMTQLAPRPNGGLSIKRLLSANTTNATSVKASAGQVYGWHLSNANAGARFLKLYDKASAPTVGSDTPVMTIPIPGSGIAVLDQPMGIAFSTGIAFALTAAVGDSDTTAVAVNEIVVNLLYK
jgi:hypothetical protein